MVWRRVPPAAVTIVRAPEDAAPFQLDLNQAPWEQLTLIDGIGETLARRIVAARERRGHFESLEEVMQLPGIPDRPFEAAREWLAVGTDGVDRLRD
ncbi:MAG: helix-hairpin-helix domain-containing protein [Planctomycetota bacterium]